MGLDAGKPLDSVRWIFLFKVLDKFSFHKIVIVASKVTYNNLAARTKINVSLSKSLTLERSCWQGCPCSPLFFALFIEPFSQYSHVKRLGCP